VISAMRQLALDYLIQELAVGDSADPEKWYRGIQKSEAEKLFPYLVEDSGKIDRVFIIERDGEKVAKVTIQDVISQSRLNGGGCPATSLPFTKPSGSQGAAVGPVIKRTYSQEKAGPTEKIIRTTLNYFNRLSQSMAPWASYFADILEVLNYSKIMLTDGALIDWSAKGYASMLDCLIDRIGKQKGAVYVTVRDSEGKLPGEQPLYIEYLRKEILAGKRYVTNNSPAQNGQTCPLCGNIGTVVYPNALKGAGLNFINVDRYGRFPGIDPALAWKGYGLCSECADLLYVYKFHVLKKKPPLYRQPFGTRVAGEKALIIPGFFPGTTYDQRRELIVEIQEYVGRAGTDVEDDEDALLELMAEFDSILNLTVLWATVGQNIDDVTGFTTQVLPSRLRSLSTLNDSFLKWKSPLFPMIGQDIGQFRLDLGLNILKPLFHRPGGNKAKAANESKTLFQLKRRIVECIYYGKHIDEERFWKETMITASWYYMDSISCKHGASGFTSEYISRSGGEISPATWIKQFNRFICYLKLEEVGVLPMETVFFEPELESLKPFFGPESGIDSSAKAYAFLLGILYGKLMRIQAARGVNVSANSLSWLKRLTLKGVDLPVLYIKIREKLLAYDAENKAIRSLIQEIGRIGISIGDNIELDETRTNYYLLLGQSMTEVVLPKTESDKKDKGDEKA